MRASLRRRREAPRRRLHARRLAAPALAAGLCALAAGAAHAQVSPGPLSEPHAFLEGMSRCTSCHELGRGATAERCFTCHQALARRVEAGLGYHPEAMRTAEGCSTCHLEHVARELPLIEWPKGGRDAFPHADATGFALEGAHARLSCAGCHEPTLVRDDALRREKGDALARSFLGLGAGCADCHDDPHAGELGARCDACHDASAFRPASRFDHGRAAFALEGRHRDVACTACHRPTTSPRASQGGGAPEAASGGANGAATGAATGAASGGATGAPPASPAPAATRWRGLAFGSCAACHADPHAGRMRGDCADCHATAGFAPARFDPPRHAETGFALADAHARATCASCHGPRLDRDLEGAACATCHEDRAHEGALGGACARCHDAAGWSPSGFASREHAPTCFPLSGRHADARCESCHADLSSGGDAAALPLARRRPRRDPGAGPGALAAAPAPRAPLRPLTEAQAPAALGAAATRPPLACAACHADPHAERLGASCGTCHDAEGWTGRGAALRLDAAAHARTAFPLAGRHAAVECAACHGGAPAGGLARLRPLAHAACSDCHADAHRGELATRADGGRCESCHAVEGFRPSTFARAAHAETTYPLRGRHEAAACDACHRSPASSGALTLRPRAADCDACHADPHAGQFARPGAAWGADRPARACASCHPADAGSWSTPGFSHVDAGFPLGGRHAEAACARCHVVDAAARPPARVYRGAPGACGACHQDPHLGQFEAGAPVKACAACHDDRRFRPAVSFDHDDGAFALEGAHAQAACSACHERVEIAEGLALTRYRGTPTRCAECHSDAHGGARWRRAVPEGEGR